MCSSTSRCSTTTFPIPTTRAAAFAAVENIPSITKKADFCMKWMDSIQKLDELRHRRAPKQFLLNLICFAGCIEGLFFFAAFAYVYFLRSKGLLHGLAAGTNWVFRDESCHLEFAFEVVNVVRAQEPDLWDAELEQADRRNDARSRRCETQFAEDLLSRRRRRALRARHAPVSRLRRRLPVAAARDRPSFQCKNPFSFMDLQDVQELTNFFERRVSAYQSAVAGEVGFHEDF